MAQPYHTIYGIPLFDDIHNYLPDILYNPTRFLSVQDLLEYIRTSIHSFSPYMRGLREYRNSQPTQTYQQLPPVYYTSQPPRNQYTYSRTASAPRATAAIPTNNTSQLPSNINARIRTTTIPLSTLDIPLDITSDSITNLMTTLFGLSATETGSLSNFLEQTVAVRPTNEDIQRATSIQTVTEEQADNMDEVCAICQEDIDEGNVIRKIRHCGHLFHKDCIDTWFLTNVRCPTCRYDIREQQATTSTQNTN